MSVALPGTGAASGQHGCRAGLNRHPAAVKFVVFVVTALSRTEIRVVAHEVEACSIRLGLLSCELSETGK